MGHGLFSVPAPLFGLLAGYSAGFLLRPHPLLRTADSARVAHAARQDDGSWLVSCQFASRLSQEELARAFPDHARAAAAST